MNKTISGCWYTYPSENMNKKSVGIMKFPTELKKKIHVPNHQPDNSWTIVGLFFPQQQKLWGLQP